MDAAEDFEQLYRATRRDVLAYLLRRTADPQDAADLLAEVYVVAWRRRADRPTGERARPWVFGVARNVLAAHVRHAVRAREAADGLRDLLRSAGADVVPERPGPDIGAALATLDETDRELLSLTAWEGLSTADAARAVGLTPSAARVRLHRARARMRPVLGPPGLKVVLDRPGVRGVRGGGG